MPLKLRNTWNYKGHDKWDWEAFIDDDGNGELQNIDYVEYILHSTFRKPIVRIKNPSNGFRLYTNGWGTFTLKAFVHKNDGSKVKLTHYIELKYDPPTGST